jgi:hypothetical protein
VSSSTNNFSTCPKHIALRLGFVYCSQLFTTADLHASSVSWTNVKSLNTFFQRDIAQRIMAIVSKLVKAGVPKMSIEQRFEYHQLLDLFGLR